MRALKRLPLALLACLPMTALATESGRSVPDSLHWNMRIRHEQVQDDAFAARAEADTLRLRLGWSPHLPHGFETLLEGEGVAPLGDHFNSGANGQTRYPVVTDARTAEINQAWLGWKNQRVTVRLGRQRLQLDDQRFIGNSGWRQNEQTFDAAWTRFGLGDKTILQVGWLNRVHRVAGDEALDPLARERALDGRVLRMSHAFKTQTLAAYGLWIEDKDVPTASSRTLGLRWQGRQGSNALAFAWMVEVARQDGHAQAHVGTADYLHVVPSLVVGDTTWRLGHEVLGRGHGRSFQTPLATLHAFNGWADKFNVTPAGGLVDDYVGVQRKFEWASRKGQWDITWHHYRADHGAGYGTEWNASAGLALRPGVQVLAKLADYRSGGFARDTRKLWLQVEWSR